MKVLVTGAGGFVGKHTAKALAALGCRVIAGVHRHRPADLDGVAGLDVVQADLAGAERFPFRGKCDAIVHCAAALPSRIPDEAELIRQNVEGTRRLLDFAVAAGTHTFLYCSSMAAFGRIKAGVVAPDTPITEPGAYGRSKLEGERLLAATAASAPLRALSLRLPGVVGAGSHDNFLSNLVAAMRADQPIVVRNPWAPFNSIVHIDNLVGFFADLLDTLAPGHRVTTIAANEPMTIGDIVSLLSAVSGREPQVVYETGDQPFLIDPEPARALGYRVPTVKDSVRCLARDCFSRTLWGE